MNNTIKKIWGAISGLNNRVSSLERRTGEAQAIRQLERRVQKLEEKMKTAQSQLAGARRVLYSGYPGYD